MKPGDTIGKNLGVSAAKRIKEQGAGNGPVSVSEVRALDRLSDAQLIAAETLIYLGLPDFRIAQRMGIDVAMVRRWFRDPVFIAACNELTRAYAAGQLVPLGLFRVRQLMADPFAKLRDVTHATRFAAELAGLYRTGTPEGGNYAPLAPSMARPLAELSRDDLHRLMVAGMQAQQRLLDGMPDPIAE